MSRYYFNLRHLDRVLPDPDGSELASLEDARLEAVEVLLDLVANSIAARSRDIPLGVEVADDDGAVLLAISLQDVLPPALQRA
ncbi:DUF6894 family protein [Rhizobium sp. 21-4511-3d]